MSSIIVSPKVTAAGAVGGLVGMFLAFANSATPEMFDGLGKWGYPVFLAISLGSALIAAFLKNDPLRVVPTPDTATTDTAAVLSSKQISLGATAVNAPDAAPAYQFPKADVAAAEAAVAAQAAPFGTATDAPVPTV